MESPADGFVAEIFFGASDYENASPFQSRKRFPKAPQRNDLFLAKGIQTIY
jgi:hypothetical protein